MAGTGVSFAGNSLQTSNILTAEIDHNSQPDKEVKSYALAHANRSKTPFTSWPGRTITISGTIFGSDILDLDARIDTLKSGLTGLDQNLDIDWAGSTRRYIATVNKCSISRPGGLSWAKFEIEFICSQPFGMDTFTTSAISASGRTANSYNDTYSFLGSAPVQLPIVTITYSAISGGTGKTVQWGNGGNGQGISVTRDWIASDVLVIDCENKTVTVNGTEVAFTGAFPEFPVGSQSMTYSDNFTTSRTFSISAIYTKRYM